MTNPTSINDYILGFPQSTQFILIKLDALIREIVPNATEAIKYGIPTYILNENLVHFAAYKSHIGFYPTPSALMYFQAELTGYKTSKGTVQFPLKQELPWDLIRRMVEFRLQENLSRDLDGVCRTKKK